MIRRFAFPSTELGEHTRRKRRASASRPDGPGGKDAKEAD
jgi:hypothetical protein